MLQRSRESRCYDATVDSPVGRQTDVACFATVHPAFNLERDRESPISIRIRTRQANGEYSDQRYMTEAAGREALEYRLYVHRTNGHTVTQVGDGDTYLVIDSKGALVQETVFLALP
jgi:hypothetical protein